VTNPVILALTITNIVACDGSVTWFTPTGKTNGMGLHCCYQATLSWTTETNVNYYVLCKAFDDVSQQFGAWNYVSKGIPGTGQAVTYSTGTPEPVFALFAIEARQQ